MVKPYEYSEIKEGDTIIEINDLEIDSINTLRNVVNTSGGDDLIIKYVRDGSVMTSTIKPVKGATEDEYKIDYYEEFGEEGIEYNPETDGSPVYLAITTDDEIGFEGAFTLVSFDEEGSGSYDGPVWGDW